jgi:hypothetical protein
MEDVSMKLRLSFLTTVAVAMALALVGVFNVSGHTIPQYPIQPFASDAQGGISNNQLGTSIAGNWTVTQTLAGERPTLPWIFSSGQNGTGFSVDGDLSITDGTPVGTVWTNIDANCDGGIDFMAFDCTLLPGGPDGREGSISPLTWLEATVQFPLPANEAFLTTIMPNPNIFPWLVRHKVDIGWLCLGEGPGQASTTSVLNTVYAGIPFSPGGSTFVAQTKLGGAPNTPPSKLCLDTPQTSESITLVYNNPPTQGDVGLPAGDDGNGLYARWTILQSLGSTSLNKGGDLRKDYASPPSIVSDTGYVERIIDLQCFWIDKDGCGAEGGAQCADNVDSDFDTVVNDGCPAVGTAETGAECNNAIDENSLDTADVGHEDDDGDATHNEVGLPPLGDSDGGAGVAMVNDGCPVAGDNCDADSSGFLSEQETWNDDDMPAAYNLIDSDGDCLIDAAYDQPGQPVDTNDEPNSVACPASPYSAYPSSLAPALDTAADSDCDTLVDGIEYAYGSLPGDADSDDDGATDFVEMFQFTNPLVQDTDGDGLLDKPDNNWVNAARTDLQCANNFDDDGDKKINDGCPAVSAAETDVSPTFYCRNNDDDDGDTVVNDGCPAAGPFAESGAQCDDAIDENSLDTAGVRHEDDDGDATHNEVPADGDGGKVNDGCPRVGNKETNCTDAVDNDGDGKVNDGCPAAGTVIAEGSATQSEYGEWEGTDDNCPGVSNPDQLNSDGVGRDNGAKISSQSPYASNPNADKMGDACDPDDDNDLAVDGYESALAQGTDPLRMDTDYDTVMDGAELWGGSNAKDNPACKDVTPQTCSRPPWTNEVQTYYRGCHINTAIAAQHSYTDWDAEYDGLENDVEMDPDGDGSKCPQSGTGDKDSDNGTGTLAAGKTEVFDKSEAFGYNTGLTQKDTDGDGCEDWVEIHDLDGNRTVDAGDGLAVAQRYAGVITGGDLASDLIFNVNKDAVIDSGDMLAVAQNSCLFKTDEGGCAPCLSDQ